MQTGPTALASSAPVENLVHLVVPWVRKVEGGHKFYHGNMSLGCVEVHLILTIS